MSAIAPAARSAAAPQQRRPARGRLDAVPVWAWGLALAIPLAAAYLIVSPPSGDLAAAAYRSNLFARAGFTIWDNGWYAGHSLPGYSLLSPALGAWLGLRPLIALSAVAASALFGAICARVLPRGAAIAATLAFAFGFCCELPSGRVPYDLGAAIALAAVAVILMLPRRALALPLAGLLAVIASAASPVAGAFVALAGLALAIPALLGSRMRAGAPGRMRSPGQGAARESDHELATGPHAADAGPQAIEPAASAPVPGGPGPQQARPPAGLAAGLVLCFCGLAPILALDALFSEGGYEPFTAGAFWPRLAAAFAFATLLPSGAFTPGARRALRIGAALYACALIGSFLILTPVGSNAVRLGDLVGPPLLFGALWQRRREVADRESVVDGEHASARTSTSSSPRRLRRLTHPRRPLALLLALAPLLVYWQVAESVGDQVALAGDRTVSASYYAPLRRQLREIAARTGPIRVEVPMTGAHWESAYLPGGRISIARGWERQLDTRFDPLFYDRAHPLTAAAYRAWLAANAVSYVALPHARIDPAARAEAQLIRAGLPYLHEIWRSRRWRLFAVAHATPLVQAPARMAAIGGESFTLRLPRPGRYLVRLHWSPYWAIASPARGCVSRAAGDLTEVSTATAGAVHVEISFALERALTAAPRCTR